MKHDFTTRVMRRGSGSEKWDAMLRDNPDLPENIVPLSVADMEFPVPEELVQGLKEYTESMIFGYTLRTEAYDRSVTDWMRRRHDWDIRPEWLVEYPGIVPALFHLASLMTKEGEGIILFTPVYYPFFDAVRNASRHLAECPLIEKDGEYSIDFELFERLASEPENTLLIFCSPHNPVGRVWTEDELRRVAEIADRNGLFVVSDEIHNDIILPGREHTVFDKIAPESLRERLVVCTAPTKTFNLAGLMISNLVIPSPTLRERVLEKRMKEGVFCCNAYGYKAAELAYTLLEGWLDELLSVIWENYLFVKSFMEEKIPEIRITRPQGTYLLWMDFRSLGMKEKELEEFMKKEALLYLDEGYIFGKSGSGYERMNLACPKEVLREALERLFLALEKRKNRT